jgi:uncharacterized membrane protein YphA (DoxX/SURF4 family)
MNNYLTFDSFKNYSLSKIYAGKISELIGGLLLTFGFLTRVGCIILMGTMMYIAFFVGHGKIWYEDQHPFLFVLLALALFFTGPGRWSIDYVLFNNKRDG